MNDDQVNDDAGHWEKAWRESRRHEVRMGRITAWQLARGDAGR